MRILLAFLVALVAALALAVSASAAPLGGIQVTGVHPGVSKARIDSDLLNASRLGAKVVRSEVRWNELEPRRGEYDAHYLALADYLLSQARARGIKVMLTIVGTPCWNTTAPEPTSRCDTAEHRKVAAEWQPRDLDAFATVAAFVASRWSADLAAIEVWNEPDQRNELYWRGDAKIPRYVAMIKRAYPAMKAAAPSVPVLAGAIVGGDGRFLEALYKEGMQGSYDGLSVHYYDLVLLSLGQIRKVRRQYGDKTPLWLGEFGWTSCLKPHRKFQDGHFCVSRKVQAQNTLDVLRVLRRQGDVRAAILYTMRDDSQYDFGVLDRKGARKPLFTAVSRAYHGRLGKARKLRLGVRLRGGRAVAVGSGPAGDAYEIDVWVGPTLRYRAVFRLNRDNRFALRLPAALGTHRLTVRVVRYTVGGRAVVARRA